MLSVYGDVKPLELNCLKCNKPFNPKGDVIYIYIGGVQYGDASGYLMRKARLRKLKIATRVRTTARIELKIDSATPISLGDQIIRNGNHTLLFQMHGAEYELEYTCS